MARRAGRDGAARTSSPLTRGWRRGCSPFSRTDPMTRRGPAQLPRRRRVPRVGAPKAAAANGATARCSESPVRLHDTSHVVRLPPAATATSTRSRGRYRTQADASRSASRAQHLCLSWMPVLRRKLRIDGGDPSMPPGLGRVGGPRVVGVMATSSLSMTHLDGRLPALSTAPAVDSVRTSATMWCE